MTETSSPTFREILRSRVRETDFWLAIAVFAAGLLALWPAARWIVSSTVEQERLWHAVLVIGLTGFALLYRREEAPPWQLEFNACAIRWVVAGFALIAGAFLFRWSVLLLPAIAAWLAACLFFCFGDHRRRMVIAFAGTFFGFSIMVWAMDPLDWPLRAVAGLLSESVFSGIGADTTLGLIAASEGPKLILAVRGHLFEVAPECNGFGLLTSSLLMTTLIGIYMGFSWLKLGGWLLFAVVLAVVMNIVRIFFIVTLAPSMMEHYDLMHEIVGGISYWSALLLLYWVLQLKNRPPGTTEAGA